MSTGTDPPGGLLPWAGPHPPEAGMVAVWTAWGSSHCRLMDQCPTSSFTISGLCDSQRSFRVTWLALHSVPPSGTPLGGCMECRNHCGKNQNPEPNPGPAWAPLAPSLPGQQATPVCCPSFGQFARGQALGGEAGADCPRGEGAASRPLAHWPETPRLLGRADMGPEQLLRGQRLKFLLSGAALKRKLGAPLVPKLHGKGK